MTKKSKEVVQEPHPYWALLSAIKKEKFDPSALLTMTDIEARMIVVWPKVQRTILGSPYDNKGVHQSWNYIDFFANDWARMANVDVDVIWERWKSLASAKMIYPDGTYNDEIRAALKTRIEAISKLR